MTFWGRPVAVPAPIIAYACIWNKSALFAGKGFSKKIRKKTDMHRKEGEYDNHEIYIQQDALFVFGHSFADRNDCLCQA